MDKEETLYRKIAAALAGESRLVREGRMMSSPAVTYKGKVFAFYHKQKMVFRLGKDFDPAAHKLKDFGPLNPFKRKGPLTGWLEVFPSERRKWERLARAALAHMKEEMKGAAKKPRSTKARRV